MIFAYIGVAVVVGLLVGFVTLSVLWTVRTVAQSIRERSIELLSTYDGLLEQRSRELAFLERELKAKREELAQAQAPEQVVRTEETSAEGVPTGFLKTAERLSGTAYRDSGAGERYRKIRADFDFDPQQVLAQLPIQQRDRSGGWAGALLRMIPYDTLYQLSTLTGPEQLELLRQTLPQEAQSLLEEYAAGQPQFDCLAFYDFVQARAAMEPGPVRLRVSPEQANRWYPPNIQVVADEDICEGFQVEADNVLYDYCIRAREIG